MAEFHAQNDGNMDYERELRRFSSCNAGKYLKDIAGLDSWYRLKDNYRARLVKWFCHKDSCDFVDSIGDSYSSADLFLRLYDEM